MKLAVPSLSKDAVLSWLLDHCEKLAAAGVFLLALGLAWSGLTAIRSKSATADLKPEKITSQANAALAHIDRQQDPPKEKLLEPIGLADSIATWIAPAEKETRKLVLSRPLFEELARRTQPDVLPIEQLQAVAGVAVLAAPADPGAAIGRPTRPGGRPPPIDPLMSGMPGELGPNAQEPDPAQNVPPARIVPYTIVTGLIPYAKQFNDYVERFENASFRDPQRDAPLWSDFLIERADVTQGPAEKWERINPKAVVQAMQKEWAGVQGDAIPAEFFLSPEEQPGLGEVTYAWPLPQLAGESWGPEAVHPWAISEWKRMVAEQTALSAGDGAGPLQPMRPGLMPSMPVGGGGQLPPGFGNPLGGGEFGSGIEPSMDISGMPEDTITRLDYKVFRFVDTAVKPGHRYRYRVRLSVWNPNYQVPAQHLADADLATATKLPSPSSNESDAVLVPGVTKVLARMPPTEPKRGTAEVLVLWPHEKTGNYALHSVTTIPGGIVSVQQKIEQEGDDRGGRGRPAKGKQEPASVLIPVGMLVDFMGHQTPTQGGMKAAAGGRRGKKAAPPAEPFELLVLGEDGELKWATPIESEEQYRTYANTLPAALRELPANPMGPDGMAPDSAFPGFQ